MALAVLQKVSDAVSAVDQISLTGDDIAFFIFRISDNIASLKRGVGMSVKLDERPKNLGSMLSSWKFRLLSIRDLLY